MRKKIHKLFWVWQFDNEENWLNEMAAKGLALVGVGFCRYEFEECTPGEYEVRLQLLENKPSYPESEKYISFVEETGAEHVGSYWRWVYFRKKKSEGAFELFSDADSKIKQLSLIITFIGLLSIANLLLGISNICFLIGNSTEFNSVGILNLAIGLLGSLGTLRLMKKRRKLKNDKQIFE